MEQKLHTFSIEDFRRSVESMIATSDTSYNTSWGSRRTTVTIKQYTRDEIEQILNKGSVASQIALSKQYFASSGFYRRILIHYATLLKYCGIIIPAVARSKKITDEPIQKKYYDALAFIDRINIPEIGSSIALKALINGAYYGIVQTLDKTHFTLLELPASYCCSRYKDPSGNDLIEFDLSYFNTIVKKEDREAAFAAYPKEIIKAYKQYKKGKRANWYLIPSDLGVCFPFYDGRPCFLSLIPTILDREEYIEADKARDKSEVKKIIIQKIPHLTDGTLLFEPDEAVEIHSGTVGMMKNNPNVDVLTTYADVDVKGSEGDSDSNSNLDKAKQIIYDEAGVSSELFSATGNLTLEKAINNDIAFMMPFAYKLSRFITNITNRLYSNASISFKYKILPVSIYNASDYVDMTFKLASSGYSYILPAVAADLTQKELLEMKDIENELLGLQEKLVPLASSFTQSGNEGAGAPKKKDSEKSDKTIKNEVSLDNGGGNN